MPTLEERVAYLEGQVSEQSHALIEVRDAVRHLEHRMDGRFEAIERRFETRFDTSDRRVSTLEDKMSRQFIWIIGVQVTTFVALVGAIIARG